MMLRSLEDALDTLKEAGARFYTISGRDLQLSHESDGQQDDPAYSVEAAQEQFTKHWARIAPGAILRVNYRTKAANRTKTDCFTVLKPSEHGTEAAPTVAGFGSLGAPDEVRELREKLAAMERAEAVRAATEPLMRRIEAMERATEGGFNLDKVTGLFANLNGLAGNLAALNKPGARPMPTRRPAGHVAAPAPPPAAVEAADDDAGQQRGADALGRLQQAIGDDAVFVGALEKLAAFVERDPAGSIQMLNVL